jgi:hypothetical protein
MGNDGYFLQSDLGFLLIMEDLTLLDADRYWTARFPIPDLSKKVFVSIFVEGQVSGLVLASQRS